MQLVSKLLFQVCHLFLVLLSRIQSKHLSPVYNSRVRVYNDHSVLRSARHFCPLPCVGVRCCPQRRMPLDMSHVHLFHWRLPRGRVDAHPKLTSNFLLLLSYFFVLLLFFILKKCVTAMTSKKRWLRQYGSTPVCETSEKERTGTSGKKKRPGWL